MQRVVKEEEDAFLRTLDKGLKKIDELIATAKNKVLEGASVFELYDTYGFPADLTRLIAAENNLTIDEQGFEKEMEKQKERSRAATALDTEDWVVLGEGGSTFVGYDSLEVRSKVLKYRRIKAKGKNRINWFLPKHLSMQKAADRLAIKANWFLMVKA